MSCKYSPPPSLPFKILILAMVVLPRKFSKMHVLIKRDPRTGRRAALTAASGGIMAQFFCFPFAFL